MDWVAGQAIPRLYLSTISEAELRYGVETLPAGERRTRLLDEVEGMLSEDFAGRILPFDGATARAYALIAATRLPTIESPRLDRRPTSLPQGWPADSPFGDTGLQLEVAYHWNLETTP